MRDDQQDAPPENEELTKFQQLARALFRVDRKDVPKHEPTKRPAKQRADNE